MKTEAQKRLEVVAAGMEATAKEAFPSLRFEAKVFAPTVMFIDVAGLESEVVSFRRYFGKDVGEETALYHFGYSGEYQMVCFDVVGEHEGLIEKSVGTMCPEFYKA